MNKYKKIMLIYGGISSEREISIISSEGIYNSLLRNNYEVIKIDADELLEQKINEIKPDVIFNALHGYWGEDGQVQRIIEKTKVPYTHSGVNSSEVAMDKYSAGEEFINNKILYPKTKLIYFNELENYNQSKFPFVLKPRNDGSSVGVSIIKNNSDKEKYIKKNSNFSEVLVQEFIKGKEIQVAIIGDKAIGSIEIVPKNEFYDYESKYFDSGETQHILPPRISKKEKELVEKIALQAHKLLKCKGISRSDFILDENNKEFYLLELNTQPGMTPTSLVPEIAKAEGIGFDKLINWILNDASTNR
jgi:D-alanine-D-alanine ligase|tara:strand:- start:646 stop:1557 length:912 start_codon:yes stop_codon:yes gene_type:complete